MSKKVNVAIIEPVGGHGGMDYYDFGLCTGLSYAGINVTLYTCDETSIPDEASYTVRLYYRKIYGARHPFARGIRYLTGTLHSLMEAKFNRTTVVHFHYFHIGFLELFNVLLSYILGFQVVITAHDVTSFVPNLNKPFLARAVYKLANRLIVHNKASSDELRKYFGISANRIFIISSGNYLYTIKTLPDKLTAREYLKLDQGAKVLLFFGQIKEVKGLDILIEAFPEILRSYPNTMLLIAGKIWKDNFSKYQQLIDQFQINSSCVKHIRFIPDEEIPYYFCASELVVLPYKRIYQSAVLLMAMSYGKPVLASNLDGITEVITNGETGFLFSSEDPLDLARQAVQILSNPGKAERIATNGRKLMKTEYGWQKVGQLTLDCYWHTLNNNIG